MAYNFNRINDSKIFPSNSDYLKVKDQFHLYDLLNDCWCLDTCAPRLRNDWSENNKTCGQCSITAFLVQDIFGGEVYGIETASGIHCFNKVGEIIFDLTSEQFKNSNELSYKLNNLQKREIHFANEEKYNRYLLLVGLLKSRLIDLN